MPGALRWYVPYPGSTRDPSESRNGINGCPTFTEIQVVAFGHLRVRHDHETGKDAASAESPCTNPFTNDMPEALSLFEREPLALVAGAGFEPATSGL